MRLVDDDNNDDNDGDDYDDDDDDHEKDDNDDVTMSCKKSIKNGIESKVKAKQKER